MLKYRPDIDGLRAVAVGSVVLYHLDESFLSGGFVGVDVFFVISGYLITKLIHQELRNSGTFSFRHFYLRRIRRLFPALLATFLFSIMAAYWLFSPAHLIEFGQSLIAAIFSVSNIFFWHISGYFDTDSSLKPLLHTWSLSVEEQFYLIWPAMLAGLFSFRKAWLIPVVVVGLGLVSLALNHILFSEQTTISSWFATKDNQSSLDIQSTAFYLLPFRVFEFSIGAILVWTGSKVFSQRFGSWPNEICFVLGLAMILVAVTTFDSTMNFPSYAALLPCLGAALIIYSGPEHRLAWVLANPTMIWLGLISYSLYLVHWPLIVFYKYWSGEGIDIAAAGALLLASIVLAYLMYRFVEQPFRKPKPKQAGRSPNRKFLLGAAFSTLLLVTVSANAALSGGWLWRYPADVVAQLQYKAGDYTEYFWANIKRLGSGFQNNQKPKVLVIGDSMAADLLNVLVAAGAEQQIDLAAIAVGSNCKGMFPLTDKQYRAIYGGAHETCRQEHAKVLAKQQWLEAADTIILASYWWDKHHLKYVTSTAEYLKSVSQANIMALGMKVQINNGIYFLTKNAFSPHISKLRTPLHGHTVWINRVLQNQSQAYQYFDLLDLFCSTDGCQRVTPEGYVIIFDDSHLSENGARHLSDKVKATDWYRTLLEKRS